MPLSNESAMNYQYEGDRLRHVYPGRVIVENTADGASELICELEPTHQHPEYSVAIAVIERSLPHVHTVATETYEVLEGTLDLVIDGVHQVLAQGDRVVISPGSVHYATGDAAWVQVTSRPGWTASDHILVPGESSSLQ